MAHIHPIIDADNHFVIDSVTRKIMPETPAKNKMVQYDHNSERYTFEIPRYVEGHDMSLCNVIQVHYINTASSGKDKNLDLYEVDDMELTEVDGEEKVFFSWLISKNATLYNGALTFAIRFACIDDEIVEYDWHTDIFSGINITLGINNNAAVVEEYSDVLEAWKQKVFTGALVNSDDVDNPTSLRDMDSGTYGLYGSFVPYTGSSYVMTFSSNIIASIIREETKSSVQIWYPINNRIWFLEISDDDYTFTETDLTEMSEFTKNIPAQLMDLSNALKDEITRAEEAEESIRNSIDSDLWNDKYTRQEVDDKLTAVMKENGIVENLLATPYCLDFYSSTGHTFYMESDDGSITANCYGSLEQYTNKSVKTKLKAGTYTLSCKRSIGVIENLLATPYAVTKEFPDTIANVSTGPSSDGGLSIIGTFPIEAGHVIVKGTPIHLKAGTYTFSCKSEAGDDYPEFTSWNAQLDFFNDSDLTTAYNGASEGLTTLDSTVCVEYVNPSVTFTIKQDAYIRPRFTIYQDVLNTTNESCIYPMLESGSVAHGYIPYIQETISTTQVIDSSVSIYLFDDVDGTTPYSKKYEGLLSSDAGVYGYLTDTLESAGSDVDSITFTIDDNAYVELRLGTFHTNTQEGAYCSFWPMLESGSVAHDYIPYNLNRQVLRDDINTNKSNIEKIVESDFGENLIPPISLEVSSYTGIDLTVKGSGNDIGSVIATGTALTDNVTSAYTQHFELQPGTYTFSCDAEMVGETRVGIYLSSSSDMYFGTPYTGVCTGLIQNGRNTYGYLTDTLEKDGIPVDSITFTINSAAYAFVYFAVNPGINVTINTTFKLMLESGYIAHTYQPYDLSRQALKKAIQSQTLSGLMCVSQEFTITVDLGSLAKSSGAYWNIQSPYYEGYKCIELASLRVWGGTGAGVICAGTRLTDIGDDGESNFELLLVNVGTAAAKEVTIRVRYLYINERAVDIGMLAG